MSGIPLQILGFPEMWDRVSAVAWNSTGVKGQLITSISPIFSSPSGEVMHLPFNFVLKIRSAGKMLLGDKVILSRQQSALTRVNVHMYQVLRRMPSTF